MSRRWRASYWRDPVVPCRQCPWLEPGASRQHECPSRANSSVNQLIDWLDWLVWIGCTGCDSIVAGRAIGATARGGSRLSRDVLQDAIQMLVGWSTTRCDGRLVGRPRADQHSTAQARSQQEGGCCIPECLEVRRIWPSTEIAAATRTELHTTPSRSRSRSGNTLMHIQCASAVNSPNHACTEVFLAYICCTICCTFCKTRARTSFVSRMVPTWPWTSIELASSFIVSRSMLVSGTRGSSIRRHRCQDGV